MRMLLLLLALAALSSPAYADEGLSAGFAPGPVWLSNSSPAAGESVDIYTVIYDASGTPIEGSVTFLIDGEPVGSAPFTLRAGDTEVRSVRWTATEGEHTLAARLDTAIHAESKQAAMLAHATAGTTTITVLPREPEPEETAEGTAPARTGADSILNASPLLGSVLGTAIQATESIRAAGETLLAGYTGQASSTATSTDGAVLGTSTERVAGTDTSIGSLAAGAALPAFRYPALFYPIAILLILLGFWIVARQLRPARRGRRR